MNLTVSVEHNYLRSPIPLRPKGFSKGHDTIDG